MAVLEAGNVEERDNVSKHSPQRKGRRTRRNRSANTKAVQQQRGAMAESAEKIAPTKDAASKRLVSIEVSLSIDPEAEAQPILTQRSGGLDIFDQKFDYGQSGVRSSASPAKNFNENEMECEAERLSGGLMNIKMVRNNGESPLPGDNASKDGNSLYNPRALQQQVEPRSTSESRASMSPCRRYADREVTTFSSQRPSHNQSRSCAPSPGGDVSVKKAAQITTGVLVSRKRSSKVSRDFFSPAHEKPHVYGTFEGLMGSEKVKTRRKAIEAAEAMLQSLCADAESANPYLRPRDGKAIATCPSESASQHSKASVSRPRRTRHSRKSSICSEVAPRAVPPMPSTQDQQEKRSAIEGAYSYMDEQDFECESPVKVATAVHAYADMDDDVNTGSVTVAVQQ